MKLEDKIPNIGEKYIELIIQRDKVVRENRLYKKELDNIIKDVKALEVINDEKYEEINGIIIMLNEKYRILQRGINEWQGC